jgi:hypothetical protein
MNEPSTERDVTVVIPVHDERVEFEEILSRYAQEFEKRGLTHEFVFVLDGTPDALFEELGRRRPAGMSVRLIKFNQPFGESIALAPASRSRGRIVPLPASVLQTDPADVQKVLDDLDRGAGGHLLAAPRVDPAQPHPVLVLQLADALLTRTRCTT